MSCQFRQHLSRRPSFRSERLDARDAAALILGRNQNPVVVLLSLLGFFLFTFRFLHEWCGLGVGSVNKRELALERWAAHGTFCITWPPAGRECPSLLIYPWLTIHPPWTTKNSGSRSSHIIWTLHRAPCDSLWKFSSFIIISMFFYGFLFDFVLFVRFLYCQIICIFFVIFYRSVC